MTAVLKTLASNATLYRASYYLAFASAVTILISITASQTFLVLSLGALLASRERLRLPRIGLPLGLFLAGTVLSLIFSPSPIHGLPQIKKMVVFSTLLVVFSTVNDAKTARRLLLCLGGAGTVAACIGVVQFARKWRQADVQQSDFYASYVTDR